MRDSFLGCLYHAAQPPAASPSAPAAAQERVALGLLVDAVSEVLEIPTAKFDELQAQSPAELRAMARHFLQLSDQLLSKSKT